MRGILFRVGVLHIVGDLGCTDYRRGELFGVILWYSRGDVTHYGGNRTSRLVISLGGLNQRLTKTMM